MRTGRHFSALPNNLRREIPGGSPLRFSPTPAPPAGIASPIPPAVEEKRPDHDLMGALKRGPRANIQTATAGTDPPPSDQLHAVDLVFTDVFDFEAFRILLNGEDGSIYAFHQKWYGIPRWRLLGHSDRSFSIPCFCCFQTPICAPLQWPGVGQPVGSGASQAIDRGRVPTESEKPSRITADSFRNSPSHQDLAPLW